MEILRSKIKSASIVMAIGVGGGGGNIVNHVYSYGERNISFLLFNTDLRALKNSNIPEKYKILLGKDGFGAGGVAENGRRMATDSYEKIKDILEGSGAGMVFIIAGMGGGTGTGAAPVIAGIAKSLGILTVGVVTVPFESEGRPRLEQAIAGVDAMTKAVDSLIIINNSHIVEMYGDLPLSKAYFKSNEVVGRAVKSISDIVTKYFFVNVDFKDVKLVMRDSGVALMGIGRVSGPNRAILATQQALTSPLLHMQDIKDAERVLVCITSSKDPEFELRMSDAQTIPAYIQQLAQTRNHTDLIWGAGFDDALGEDLQVIIIATGFNYHNIPSLEALYKDAFSEEKPATTIKIQPTSHRAAPAASRPAVHTPAVPRPQQAPRMPLEPEPIVASTTNPSELRQGAIFQDFTDTRPAYLRRQVKLGHRDSENLEEQSKPRRHRQRLEPEEPAKTEVNEPSLFDDDL